MAMLVREDLYFDMAGLLDVFLMNTAPLPKDFSASDTAIWKDSAKDAAS